MRIVFMGATELGWNCCRTLLEIGQEVVGIFSIPQQFKISWSPTPVTNVQYRSFADLADGHSIPLIDVTKKMAEYREDLRQLRPDIIIVVGWYYMLPRSLRELAPLGAAGLHASLLPKYRGGAPLVWATINGETRTGVSFFYFADAVDNGDIIGQESFEIALEDDIAALVQKASRASVDLMKQYVPALANGNAPRVKQDHTQATVVPQRKPEDGLIDWQACSARQAYDWIRAQTRPYPGAFTFLNQEKVVIWKASLTETQTRLQVPAGTILADPAAGTVNVCCADGRPIQIDEVGLSDGSILNSMKFSAVSGLGTNSPAVFDPGTRIAAH